MGYNINSGYGKAAAEALHGIAGSTGKVFMVARTAAAGRQILRDMFGGDPDGQVRYQGDIDSAINLCTADRGDVILVAPNHTESLTTAGDITLDIAGTSVIGLGVGNNRPVLTFASTNNAASVAISGDDCAWKNIVGVCGDDGLTNAYNVTGDNCDLDIEWQDGSATVEAATAVRLDTANNCRLKLKYNGFTAGNAVTAAVILDDCDNVYIDIDAYGVNSTSWVDFQDVASTNVYVTGYMYTASITDYTQDVTDTVTGSTWYATLHDGSAGAPVSGGSGNALAAGDLSAIAALIGAVNDTTTDTLHGKIGTDTEMGDRSLFDLLGGTGFVAWPSPAYPANDVSLAEAIRYIADAQSGTVGLASFPAGAAAANDVSIAEALRFAQEAIRNSTGGTAMGTDASICDALGSDGVAVSDTAVSVLGAIGANNNNNAFDSTNVVANRDGSVLERTEFLMDELSGAAGLASYPDAANPADGVSMAEVIRMNHARSGVIFNPLAPVIYVVSSGGADGNAGTCPTEPKDTIASAITAAGAGGTIVLGPGAHAVDVSSSALVPLANQRFVSAIPAETGAPTALITPDADDGADLITLDVGGVSFEGIHFFMVAGGTAAVNLFNISQTTAVLGLAFKDCWFDLNDVDGAGITALNVDDGTNATTGMTLKNCRFFGGSATTNQAVYVDVGVGGVPSMLVEGCTFECESADGDCKAFLFADPGGANKCYGMTIKNNDFIGATDGGGDVVPIEFNGSMTENEIVGMIRDNSYAGCAQDPITADKVDASIATPYNGNEYNPLLGYKVTRAPADIFDGTTTGLFTVSGGNVLITALHAVVGVAAIDGAGSNTKFQANPTTGTTTDLCANLDINAHEAGTIYSVDGVPATALVAGSSGSVQGMSVRGVVVAPGSIELVSAVDVGTGGAVGTCLLYYMPLDAGASIAAA